MIFYNFFTHFFSVNSIKQPLYLQINSDQKTHKHKNNQITTTYDITAKNLQNKIKIKTKIGFALSVDLLSPQSSIVDFAFFFFVSRLKRNQFLAVANCCGHKLICAIH